MRFPRAACQGAGGLPDKSGSDPEIRERRYVAGSNSGAGSLGCGAWQSRGGHRGKGAAKAPARPTPQRSSRCSRCSDLPSRLRWPDFRVHDAPESTLMLMLASGFGSLHIQVY